MTDNADGTHGIWVSLKDITERLKSIDDKLSEVVELRYALKSLASAVETHDTELASLRDAVDELKGETDKADGRRGIVAEVAKWVFAIAGGFVLYKINKS